ncbi:hypothetical protein OSTOST_13076, partial [Ostertagia ostertagi]
ALETSRNPINISTDNIANSTGSVYEEVQNPTADNIRAKIANMIRSFSTTTGSSGIQYRVFTSDNDADLSIKLSAAGGYAGFKASAGFESEQTEKKYYLTIDAIKPLYTLISSVPSNGYFSDKSIEANNQNLIVLKSVTYGSRVLANLEITLQTQKDAIDFKASFGADSGKGISANASATFNYLKTAKNASTTANVYIVGGPLNTTLFETDKLQQQITELIARCNYQTAQPIAYSFTDINGNVLGIESSTDKFTTTKCVPSGSVYKLVAATVQIYTGKDNKEQGSNASVTLSKPKGPVKPVVAAFEKMVAGTKLPYKMINDSLAVIPYEGENVPNYQVVVHKAGDLIIVFVNLSDLWPGKLGAERYEYLLQQAYQFDILKIGMDADDKTIYARADLYKTTVTSPILGRVIRQVANVTNILGAQLSLCDSFVNWMQASYIPKGGLGDAKKMVTEKIGLYNEYVAALPQAYGAYTKTYTDLRYNKSGKIEPMSNSHVQWSIVANGIIGIRAGIFCTPSQYYFTLPSFAEQGYDNAMEKLGDRE